MKQKWTEKQFIIAITNNITIAGVLREIGLKPIGSNYKTFNKTVKKLFLNINHFKGQSHGLGKPNATKNTKSLDEILIINSDYTAIASLKKRLIRDGLLKNKCNICTIHTWQDKPLVLQLDHINGINNDHRLENLRLICPNCHSQTETFSGKNTKRNKTLEPKKINYYYGSCKTCGDPVHRKNCNICLECYHKQKPTKINWPIDSELIMMVNNLGFSQASRDIGVSDNAIRKRLRTKGILSLVGAPGGF